MKHFFTRFLTMAGLVMSTLSLNAQQLPDPGFEDWSGAKFDGNIQMKCWNASNLEQTALGMTFRFNFMTRETGRSGYCAKIENKEVGAAGLTEKTPGYFTLGKPWQYISGLDVNGATGGTDGGLSFTYRPDSMYVWIKRGGSSAATENYSILFYSWKGTSSSSTYRSKDKKSCTNTGPHTNEESDVRQALDANDCGTMTKATQIAEGWVFEKKQYNDWTQIKVPIYYLNDEVPQMCNVIFSSTGYPNFRNQADVVVGNSLCVDDVELIYSSKIEHLYIGGLEWNGFDPNSSEEQVYSVGHTTEVPEVYGTRGAGKITNVNGTTVNFPGRKLSSSEMTVSYGKVDGAATVITVKSGDGKSTRTYKIKMVQAASENAKLKSILVNGNPISNFNPQVGEYHVALPYGTTAAPNVTYVKAEDKQAVEVTQATSPTGKATIKVTAADGKTTKTYTLNFSVAALADNTLKGIKVNGEEIADFFPEQTSYRVELPLGTTQVPTVEAISAYPKGAQTITYTPPTAANLDNSIYLISVTTPGNQTAMIYRLQFKITASTNCRLKDLRLMVGGKNYIENFASDVKTYYVTLPMGTSAEPAIEYTKGDAYQTVDVQNGGVDGTSVITVTAASGDKMIYKIICKTEKSDVSHLNMIYVDGKALEGFDPTVKEYSYQLPPGTTALPAITWDKGDEFETVTVAYGGLNGTTRITVVAGDGSTMVYRITFALELNSNTTLNAIYLDGELVEGFASDIYTYDITLPKTATALPAITWDLHDASQEVKLRTGGMNGNTTLTVRAQTGASQVYTLRFHVDKDSINHLTMIYLDGEPLANFHKDTLNYIDSLPTGVSKIPAVSYDLAATTATAKVLNQGNKRVIRVTAEDGSVREYAITFIISKSESAFPKMIYVDGAPLDGFDPKELEYTYEFEGDVAPAIEVEKVGNQQVIILTPVRDGLATIIVAPEGGGDGNTYTINLVLKPTTEVQLAGILIDGKPLQDFRGDKLTYTYSYTDEMPLATCVAADGQTVNTLRERNITRFVVTAAGEAVTYIVTFEQILSADATLKAILLNGVAVPGFRADSLQYSITLPAGSVVPEITYEAGNPAQTIVLGQTGDKLYAITVQSEDGEAKSTYTLDFTIEQFTSVEPESIRINGTPLALEEGVYTYEQTIDAGSDLPELDITPAGGQTILTVNTSDTQQQIIVKSEDGRTATYTINYTPVFSSEAQLHDILLDGVSMEGFAADTYHYTHELAWRTKVVPVIHPVGVTPNQKIEITYGAINAQTHIHVTAADKVTTADYYIDFPVKKSNNVALEDVSFNNVNFTFDPEQTDYVIPMPYHTTAVPVITYSAAEPEQQVKYVSAPISGVTRLIVTAENGDQREYTFRFEVARAEEANVLKSLVINTNKQQGVQRTLAEDETDITIDLPYGTTELNFGYVKNYEEQAVLVQQGGIFADTKITVKANRGDEADKVYTITPHIEMQNPAVLESITVNGSPLAGFDKNRFSYVINVTDQPTVVAKDGDDEIVVPTEHSSKHWQATVTKDGYTNTYDIWYYYSADVIPNGDFTEWTSAKTYSSAQKPTGWNVLADFAGQYSYLGFKFNPGGEVTKNGTSVAYLHTKYNSSPLAGYVPGYITLGTINYTYARWGSSSFSVSGGITFRNTPDVLSVNYKNSKLNNNNRILYTLTGSKETKTITYTDNATSSNYVTRNISLSDANATAGVPTMMNIVLNSFDSESGKNGTAGGEAQMYVDWVRFVYNSSLSRVKVNGADATMAGETFSYMLPSSETIGVPNLTFVGEVSDQAQKVVWNNTDPKALTRTAIVTNYAEDGTSTLYTVEVNRPKSKINTLDSICIDGVLLTGWDAATTEYDVPVAFGQKRLHDVHAFQGSNLQTVVLEQSADEVTITVTAEDEAVEAKVYKVKFVEQKSNDVTLSKLYFGNEEQDPTLTEFAISEAVMPAIRFTKKTDGQTVTLDGNHLYIIAEDGETKSTITITNTPPAIVSAALLSEIAVNGDRIEGFDEATFRYEAEEPQPTSFIRMDEAAVVVQTITPDSITWQVQGSSEQNTYALVYPKSISDDPLLAAIKINGEVWDEFIPSESECPPFYSNEPIHIEVVAQPGQTISAAISVEELNGAPSPARKSPAQLRGFRYTIDVTAEDGIKTFSYVINVLPEKSGDAFLKMIRLNGADLEGFDANTMRYVVTQPAANPKLVEPKLPSVAYVANQYAQMIQFEVSQEQDTTYNYITVTSEDGMNENVYELLVTNEPSHNADVTDIMIDGKRLNGFSPERTYYSTAVTDLDVEVGYSAEDRFLTIEKILNGNTLTLHVVAQDKITAKDYIVALYAQPLSADASLANILLNGQSFTDYDASLTAFTPMNSYYTIPVSAGQKPDVSAELNQIGQTMSIVTEEDKVFITVTAEDGMHSNTYVITFLVQRSSDVSLAKLEAGDSIITLVPGQYDYTFALPVGVKTPWAVTYELSNYDLQSSDNEQAEGMNWSVDVSAEDGTTVTYTVHFVPTLSQNATLEGISANFEDIPGFRPDSFYYAVTLPMGERTLRELSFTEGDEWQREQVIDTLVSGLRTLYRCNVLAEDSIHRNVYTVSVDITPSDVDTLAAITVAGMPLVGFDPYVCSYTYMLSAGATELPHVEFEQGDIYQHVDSVSNGVGGAMTIIVTAENGNQRRYTILFITEPDNNTGLAGIYYGGKELGGFDPEVYEYTITLPYGTTDVPVVTYTKANPDKQQDVMTLDGNVVTITITAEDGTTATYTLTFVVAKSSEAHLSAITVDDQELEDFEPGKYNYSVYLPYGTTEMPQVGAVTVDSTATYTVDADDRTVTITVTAADGDHTEFYTVNFIVKPCPINWLEDIQVKGVSIEGFDKDSFNYVFEYPVGSDSTMFFTVDDVQWTVADASETVKISEENGEILILVTAADETQNLYTISQTILLSNNSLLSDLTLDGRTIRDFDAETYEYTYEIMEGEALPEVAGVAQDEAAEVLITMAAVGEVTKVFCIAADGTRTVYSILFEQSSMNTALTPQATDVLLKQIPGTDQFAAYSLRMNTWLAVYDHYGHLLLNQTVPVCNPNDVVMSNDPTGREVITDASGNAAYFTLPAHGQTFYYLFYSDGKRIRSGKFMVQ